MAAFVETKRNGRASMKLMKFLPRVEATHFAADSICARISKGVYWAQDSIFCLERSLFTHIASDPARLASFFFSKTVRLETVLFRWTFIAVAGVCHSLFLSVHRDHHLKTAMHFLLTRYQFIRGILRTWYGVFCCSLSKLVPMRLTPTPRWKSLVSATLVLRS